MTLIMTKDKAIINVFNTELKKSVRYNLITKELQRKVYGQWRTNEEEYDFFRGHKIEDIEYSDDKFRKLMRLVAQINPRCSSVATFMKKLDDALIYEEYIQGEVDFECYKSSWGRKHILTKPLNFYNKNMISFFKENDIKITLDIEDNTSENYDFFKKLIEILKLNNFDANQKRNIFQDCSDDYTLENIMALINDYHFEMKSLLNYIINYLVPFENINFREGITLLKDYSSMAKEIGREVKKYPKYLRSMHDIITSNHNAFKQEYDEKKFLKVSKPNLETNGKIFSIIIPKCSKDIIQEGVSLNHCVGSYVQQILDKKCYIFFLRKTDNLALSLVTLELRDKEIRQAKGSYNRKITEDEKEFLVKYCKKMKFKLAGAL